MMIRALNIKLWRDLWRQRWQCLAILAIVACGVASQVTSFSLIASLTQAMETYYEQARFPELFLKLSSTPLTEVVRFQGISGVSAVQPRMVVDAPLRMPDQPDDPATVTLIGVPQAYQSAANCLIVRQGVPWADLQGNQVLVSEAFAEARGLKIHDRLVTTIRGRTQELTVAGIAISPEYLFQIREGAGVPDNRRFAVAWMEYGELARLSGKSGQCNDLLIRLNATPSAALVQARLLQELPRHQLLDVHDRALQISHRYTTNAIKQLYSVAIVPPILFLAVASFLIYIATSRLVKLERENIAMQMAFGYSSFRIAGHYLSFVLIVALAGCCLGVCGGWVLAHNAAGMYRQIYRFPSLPIVTPAWSVVGAVLAATVAGLCGGSFSIWRAVCTPPAIGLRPEPPASYRLTWLDRLGTNLNLSPVMRMVLRGLGRWKLRTGLGVCGVALGIGVMILGSYTQGAIAYVIDFEFFFTRRYDVMVQFTSGTSSRVIPEIGRLPGVLQCEPFASTRCVLRHGPDNRTVTVLGIASRVELMQPVTTNLQPIQLNAHGLAVSHKLAEAIGVQLGTTMEMVELQGSEETIELPVESLVTDYAGLNAYTDLLDFQRWFQRGDEVDGVFLQIDNAQLPTLIHQLHQNPRVQAVTIKHAALENYKANDSKNLLLFRVFNILFSSIIGIGAVTSIASISLAERQKDMALMRVLGYSSTETGRVLIGELAIIMLLAIPVGCLAGFGFATLATWMLNSETQRIPLLIKPEVYWSAVLVSLLACCVAAGLIQRRVSSLDCVDQLKSRD